MINKYFKNEDLGKPDFSYTLEDDIEEFNFLKDDVLFFKQKIDYKYDDIVFITHDKKTINLKKNIENKEIIGCLVGVYRRFNG